MRTGEKPRGLDVDQDLGFEKTEWIVQRIFFIAMILFSIAALAGVFAFGPVSSAQKQSSTGVLSLQYDRFARYLAPTDLKIRFRAQGDEALVHINQEYLEAFKVEQIIPEPSRALADPDGVSFYFAAGASKQGSAVFHLEPQKPGPKELILKTHGDELAVRQLVYP